MCSLWCQIQTYSSKRCTEVTTSAPCPSRYINDPEEAKLCQLWAQLVQKQREQNSNGTAVATTIKPVQMVQCVYAANPTSAEALCLLWCQLELFEGRVCHKMTESSGSSAGSTTTAATTTAVACPYADILVQPLLCQLWEQLQTLSNSITTTVQSGGVLKYCPYNDHAYSMELCKLWCDIQGYYNVQCSQCPSSYTDEPQYSLVCELWLELENINNNNGGNNNMVVTTTVGPSSSAECPYARNSSDTVCQLWCAIELTKGTQCSTQCPNEYQSDPENVLLCQIHAQENFYPFFLNKFTD